MMHTSDELGRLQRVNVREIWKGEATHFTPWLASENNLQLLDEALGLELELEAQEKSVGPFRADLLCKNRYDDQWVLIENQLERTDHTHLGQVLTYASGLKAVKIVWIATEFTEEHRSTLDWLNEITDERFMFFGLELEAWRIGDSRAAPKFNVISKPNNWSKSVSRAAKAIDENDLSEIRLRQRRYWEGLHQTLDRMAGPVSGDRKAQPQPWMSYRLGKAGVTVNASMSRPNNVVRAEIYLSGPQAAENYLTLKEFRSQIESALGFELDWEDLEGSNKRISYSLPANADEEPNWSAQHEWLAKHLNSLHRVFSRYLNHLS